LDLHLVKKKKLVKKKQQGGIFLKGEKLSSTKEKGEKKKRTFGQTE
jgi:hypothetical protein